MASLHIASIYPSECRLTSISQTLHIHNRNLNPLLRKQLHDNLANTIRSTRHNNNLLAPIIRIIDPVVRHGIVEPAVDAVHEAQRERKLQILEGGDVLRGEGAALLRVARREDERERELGVQHRVLEEVADGVGRDAC